MKLGVVILTMGNRPAELARLLDSVLAQSGAPLRIVVVGNGAQLAGLPEEVEAVELPENRGVPAGRNAGLAALRAHGESDVVMYLDDDGLLPDPRTAEQVCDLFATTPDLGIVSFRVADETGATQRRHRHAVYFRMIARNRVWLARRHLPAPLVPAYLAVWAAVTLARRPPAAGMRAWTGGFIEGCRTRCGPRRPIRWRTVWRMTRLGRPPII